MIITIVGNEGVGKSSLVEALVRERAPISEPQHVMPEIIIPPEWNSEKFETRIVDTSSALKDREQVEREIARADVICIVYALDDINSLESISDDWIPFIEVFGEKEPSIILVGNKLDLCDEQSEVFSNVKIIEKSILNNSKGIEALVRCSTKKLFNVSEVFYLAQYAYCYPIKPLFDYRHDKFKPAFDDALRRIYKLCCSGSDEIMTYGDLSKLQSRVFGSRLLSDEIDAIKDTLTKTVPDALAPDGITETGFIDLFYTLVHHGNLQVPWSILKKFGYGEDLKIRSNVLHPEFKVPQGYSVELSSDGYRFLIDLFKKYDKDNDGALNSKELDDLFATSPGNPWINTDFPETTTTNFSEALTLKGFLMQFCMTTFLDFQTTIEYLFYLGFENDTRTALKLTTQSGKSNNKNTERSVFLCYVFGGKSSGKTSLLRSFVNKDCKKNHSNYTPKKLPYSVVNSVEINGIEKSLIIQEFSSSITFEVINNHNMISACDVALLLYDSSDSNSFSYIADVALSLRVKKIKTLIASTKVDAHVVPQNYPISVTDFCHSANIHPPVPVSVIEVRPDELFVILASVAASPETNNGSTLKAYVSYLLKAFAYSTGSSLILLLLLFPFHIVKKVRRVPTVTASQ